MAKKSANNPAAKTLPQWDLRDLYEAPDGLSVVRDFKKLEQLCTDFRKAYEDKVATLGADALAKAIREYEAIQEISGKLGSYAQLCFAGNMSDPAITQFYQNTQEKLT